MFMASKVCSRVVLSCRSFSNNVVKSAAGRRCITSKSRGFTTGSSKALPLVFGVVGVGSVLGGLHAAKYFDIAKPKSSFLSLLVPSVHAAKKVNRNL